MAESDTTLATHSDHPAPRGDPSAPAIPGYEVVRELGRGGMGVVYLARHLALNRIVALKMILAGAAAGPDQRERFLREAHTVAQLRHPNLVQVYDSGEAGGQPYLAMEYVEGSTLAERLGGGPLDARAAADVVRTLARAVAAAHGQHVIHRDLKPGNVLGAGPGGTLKISDFGLAKHLDGDDLAPTRSDAIVGTVAYMAPEQARGARHTGPACDLYALGAILYECLTGRPPHGRGHYLELLQKLQTEEPIPPRRLTPGVPQDLETICLKCLEKNPAQRYASAEALADDLERFQQDRPVLARPLGRIRTLGRWCRRNPALATLTALATLAVLATLGLTTLYAVTSARSAHDLGVALTQAQRRLAETEQTRGLALLEAGETDLGLLWLAQALGHLPAGSDDLDDDLRQTIGQELQTQRALRSKLTHDEPIEVLVPSPDGRRALTAGKRRFRFWDLERGQPLGEPQEYPGEIATACWHPGGQEVAVSGAGPVGRPMPVLRVHVADGRRLEPTPQVPANEAVVALAWTPQGDRLLAGTVDQASAGSQGLLLTWDAPTYAQKSQRVQGMVVALACHPRKELAAVLLDRELTSRVGGVVRFLHHGSGAVLPLTLERLDKPGFAQPSSLHYSPQGDRLWTVAGNRLQCWDTETGQLLDALGSPREANPRAAFDAGLGTAYLTEGAVARGHALGRGAGRDAPVRHADRIAHLAYIGPESRLVTASRDGCVCIWEPPSRPGVVYSDLVSALAFSSAGDRAFSASESGQGHLWTGAGDTWTARSITHPDRVQQAAFAADGALLLTTAQRGRGLYRWRASDGTPVGEPQEFPAYIHQLAPGPRGTIALVAGQQLHVLDGATRRDLFPPAALRGSCRLVRYTPDGAGLLTVSQDERTTWVASWDASTGASLAPPEELPDSTALLVDRVATDAGGTRLVYWADTNRTQVYDLARHQVVYRGAVRASPLVRPHFQGDGTLLLGSENGGVEVLDWERGAVRTSVTHGGGVTVPRLCADALLTGGADGSVRAWDRAGRPRGRVWRHPDAVRDLILSPDGRWVLVGCRDGSVGLWDRLARVDGAPAEVRRRLEKVTGLTLSEEGRVEVLTERDWRQR